MKIENVKEEKFSLAKEILSFVQLVVIALVIIIPLKYFVVEPFIVSGSSMSPNFETGHYVIVNKMSGKLSDITRGEVLVFVPPSQRSDNWLKYTGYLDPRVKYIKRVIGLPGETVKLENHKVFIKKVGAKDFVELNEPYIKNHGTTRFVNTLLKSDEYFMLGDNRGNSYDSEEWGPIRKSDIMGSPILRIIPFGKFGVNPADYSFKN